MLDIDSRKLVGKVDTASRLHHVAIASEVGRGFSTNVPSVTLTVFDLKTLGNLGEIKLTGEGSDAIMYDPPTGRVIVAAKTRLPLTPSEARWWLRGEL